MTLPVKVELRTSSGRHVETVEVGPLATDAAAIDMARRQAGISGAEFNTGVVLA
ncbi:hypothetical protein [Halorubrum sp. N11]|uniref:hypothetical protein n=1 Tax=Halorubrum sp. N11 TaxID=3402276 RepID=UPI003EBE8E2F